MTTGDVGSAAQAETREPAQKHHRPQGLEGGPKRMGSSVGSKEDWQRSGRELKVVSTVLLLFTRDL